MEYLHSLTGWQAYVLLCGLVWIEECGVPVPFAPADVVLLAGGYLAAIGVVHLGVFLPAAFVSMVLGAIVCYTVSRALGRGLVLRHGRYVGVTRRRLARAESWLDRTGAKAILVARLLPGTRINASFAAGILHLPRDRFVYGVLPSSAVFVVGFTVAGYALGDRATPLLPWFDRLVLILASLGAVALAIWWAVTRSRRPNRSHRARRARGVSADPMA